MWLRLLCGVKGPCGFDRAAEPLVSCVRCPVTSASALNWGRRRKSQVAGRSSQNESTNEISPKKAEKSSKKLRLWLGQGERGEREPFVMPATGSEDQEPTPAAVIALFSRLLPPPATSVDSESRKPKGYYNNKKQPMSGPHHQESCTGRV